MTNLKKRASNRCLIWGTESTIIYDSMLRNWNIFSPRTCGQYAVSQGVQGDIDALDIEDRAKLTSAIIERRNNGDPIPTVTDSTIHESMTRRALSNREKDFRLLSYLKINSERVKRIDSNIRTYEMMAQTETISEEELTDLFNRLMRDSYIGDNYELTLEGECLVKKIRNYAVDKIDRVSREISNGTYRPDYARVANNMLETDRLLLESEQLLDINID
ncbi:MAG: flagellar biosynthesis anti-sigma factor FlgM [Sedimenticola sp.]